MQYLVFWILFVVAEASQPYVIVGQSGGNTHILGDSPIEELEYPQGGSKQCYRCNDTVYSSNEIPGGCFLEMKEPKLVYFPIEICEQGDNCMTYHYYGHSGTKRMVIRGCSRSYETCEVFRIRKETKELNYTIMSHGGQEFCNICDDFRCNSQTVFKPSSLIILFLCVLYNLV